MIEKIKSRNERMYGMNEKVFSPIRYFQEEISSLKEVLSSLNCQIWYQVYANSEKEHVSTYSGKVSHSGRV